jgi:hypothetical protein
VPTVEIGGASILSLLIADPTYAQNDLRQDLWRAGHAHAGVWLVLSLVALRYVDEATLSEGMRWVVRIAFPAAALLMPLAFFLSVLSPEATEPNALIYQAYVAGVVLAVGLLVLGVGLLRRPLTPREMLTGSRGRTIGVVDERKTAHGGSRRGKPVLSVRAAPSEAERKTSRSTGKRLLWAGKGATGQQHCMAL